MRVQVDLASGLDAERWRLRNARDEVPDASPYGLHRLEEYGLQVSFRRPAAPSRVTARLARSMRHRTGGLEIVEAFDDSRRIRADGVDAVLGYDERTSVPAVLRHMARGGPPVVAGVGWLSTRTGVPALHARLAALALPRAALVWAQCAPMLPLLREQWKVPASRMRCLTFGIDAGFYAVQPPPERRDVIASAGEDRFRDHDLLIRAVESLRRTRASVRLELATALPVRMPDGLGVLHTERLDGRMRGIYQRATVVAVALRPCVTGSGLSVMLEAMSCGRALVATANPGIEDYIEHGVTGLLVAPGDERALAGAIADLLDDPSGARELAANAAKAVRERFTSDVMAEELALMINGM